MEYTEAHGLTLSKLVLGTVQLGMPYGIANHHGQPTLQESFELLNAARRGGVTCFDTAAQYGSSEEVLGRYFGSTKHPSACTIVTKFKIDPAGDLSPAGIEAQVAASARRSLARLGLPSLPLLLAHTATDVVQYGPAIVRALARLKEEGVIQRAGVSIYEASHIDALLEYDLFEAVQLPMNVFDQRLVHSGHLEKLRKAGFIVFVRSVFLQGLFFLESLPEGFTQAERFVRRLRGIAAEEGVTVGQLALAFVRDLPGVTSLVLGAETVDQVKENVQLLAAPALSKAAVEKLAEMARDIPIEELMAEIVSRK